MSLDGALARGELLGSESIVQVPLFMLRLVLGYTPSETTDSGEQSGDVISKDRPFHPLRA